MLAIAVAYRFADHRDGLGAGLGPLRLAVMVTRVLALGKQGRFRVAELVQPGFKGGFDRPGIRDRELVFEGEGPMRPRGKSLRLTQLLKLRHQLTPWVFRGVRR